MFLRKNVSAASEQPGKQDTRRLAALFKTLALYLKPVVWGMGSGGHWDALRFGVTTTLGGYSTVDYNPRRAERLHPQGADGAESHRDSGGLAPPAGEKRMV